MNVGGATGSVQ